MGQIIGSAAKPKRCNINQLSQLGTPAAGEYILVSSDNSMNAAGQGNFDCYIVGDGTKAATALELKSVDNDTFDISAYHATGDVLAKYADLSAALDGGSNIPQAFRKGGMSVKFVQSSDNKYVEYRFLLSSFTNADFARVVNWQGIDDSLLAESKNIATSKGAYNLVQGRFFKAEVKGLIRTNTGVIDWQNSGWYTSDFIPVVAGMNCSGHLFTGTGSTYIAYYDSSKTFMPNATVVGTVETSMYEDKEAVVPSGAAYLRFCSYNPSTNPYSFGISNYQEKVDEAIMASISDVAATIPQAAVDVSSGEQGVTKSNIVYGYLGEPFNINGNFSTSGVYNETSAWRATDYIPVAEGDKISLYTYGNYSSNATALLVFYDEDKVKFSTVPASVDGWQSYEGIVPSGAAYLRSCCFNVNTARRKLIIYGHSYKEYFNGVINGVYNDLDNTLKGFVVAEVGDINCNTYSSNPETIFWNKISSYPKEKFVHAVKFKAHKNVASSLYVVTIVNNVATTSLLKTEDNTNLANNGDVVRVVLDVTLAENQYIGISGGIYYENSGKGSSSKYYYCSVAGGNVSGGVSDRGVSLVEEVISFYPGATPVDDKCEVIVDINGKGDYTNPFDAIVGLLGKDTAAHPYTIKVLPGTYDMPTLLGEDESTYCNNRYLSIVGTDKVNCILRNDKGYYNASASAGDMSDNSPLKLSGNIYLANLTIISTDTENASESASVYHRSYCIHMDAAAAEGSIMEVHNCHLINNHAPCIGFGIPKNVTLKITDCELEADFHSTNVDWQFGGAIIYGHDRQGGSTENIEEHIMVKNTTFVSSNGDAFKSHNSFDALLDVAFVNCVCDLAAGKSVVLSNKTSLNNLSYGNNVESMNYAG